MSKIHRVWSHFLQNFVRDTNILIQSRYLIICRKSLLDTFGPSRWLMLQLASREWELWRSWVDKGQLARMGEGWNIEFLLFSWNLIFYFERYMVFVIWTPREQWSGVSETNWMATERSEKLEGVGGRGLCEMFDVVTTLRRWGSRDGSSISWLRFTPCGRRV